MNSREMIHGGRAASARLTARGGRATLKRGWRCVQIAFAFAAIICAGCNRHGRNQVVSKHSAAATRPTLSADPRAAEAARREALLEFTSGILVHPRDEDADAALRQLAPLILQSAEGGHPQPPREVYGRRANVKIGRDSIEQATYIWPAGDANRADQWIGVRITLGRDGFPALWEILDASPGPRRVFLSRSMEKSAAGIERGQGAVVARILDDGPEPMGPIAMVTAAERLSGVLCRCMPAQYSASAGTGEYELRPLELVPPEVLKVLRLRPDGVDAELAGRLNWDAAANPAADSK